MSRYGPGPGPGFPVLQHGAGVFHWLLLAVLIGFLALGVIVLVRMWNVPRDRRRRFEARFEGRKHHRPAIDPAFNELRIRYARGDIGVEEYAERAHNLGYPLTPETVPEIPAAPGIPATPGTP